MKRALVSALVLLASLILGLARFVERGEVPGSDAPREPRRERSRDTKPREDAPPATSAPRADSEAAGQSYGGDTSEAEAALREPRRREQVDRVIEAFERTGRPPDGVAQGGRRGGPKGVFDNVQGVLPRKPPRWYTESDVWPKQAGRNRGRERLVFGKEGEVYFTYDHYKTFLRLR